MQNLKISDEISEGKATEVIMDACRCNPRRERVVFRQNEHFDVSFTLNANGTYQVAVRNHDEIVVAIATVDEFDC